MSSQSLQTDKLTPIDLPEICAPRLELLGRFDKASAKRCIYINAPAGCGKTISARLWIQKSGYTPIWLGLDAYDNTPVAFYRLFCMAFFSVIPQEEALSRLVKEPAFSVSPVEYTIEILSRFSFDHQRYALVLDDFHLITNEEILKSLIFVAKRLPLSITTLILSRSELPQLLSPLEENGKIAFIGASELAFNRVEIRRYFASFGRFITAAEADNAFSLTEGWAIAVGALALSGDITSGEKPESNPLQKYIKTQLWDKLDEELRRFMLRTSVVDKFSVRLGQQLTQDPRSPELLDRLLSGNMFISRQDIDYRYHHLFLAFLREEAEKETPSEQHVLYQRAADYYYETGDHFNALRYYIRCGNGKGISGAVYHYMRYSGQSSSDMSKIYFINELPSDILEKNPVLYVSCAYCALLFSEAQNLYHYLDRIYERLGDIVRENEAFFGGVLFLFTVDPRYTFTEQLARLHTLPSPRTDSQYIPKTLTHNLPFLHRTYRDHSHYVLDPEKHFADFRSMFSSILGSYGPIIEAGIRAGLLYEKNLLKDALDPVEHDPDTDSGELLFSTRMLRASCLYALGRTEEAAKSREEIRVSLKKEGTLYLLPVFTAYEIKLKLMDGDKAAAKAWLDNYFVTEGLKSELNRIYMNFTTIRAYIVLEEYEKAQKLCRMLRKLSGDFHRLLDKIEAEVLLTITLWLTGKKEEAAQLLRAALANTEPYRFVRIFADEGKALLPVLKKLVKDAEKNRAPDPPGPKYSQEVYLAAYEQSKRHKGIACAAVIKPVKLSAQQKYILELLAKGYNNAEIVQLTGLSINTVRSHAKAAYQKLEVSNKLDAVLRARELELID